MDNNNTPEQQNEQQPNPAEKIIPLLKLMGAAFMIAAPIAAFDIQGVATKAGIADGITEKAIGGVLFMVGVVDFFVLPMFLGKNNRVR